MKTIKFYTKAEQLELLELANKTPKATTKEIKAIAEKMGRKYHTILVKMGNLKKKGLAGTPGVKKIKTTAPKIVSKAYLKAKVKYPGIEVVKYSDKEIIPTSVNYTNATLKVGNVIITTPKCSITSVQ